MTISLSTHTANDLELRFWHVTAAKHMDSIKKSGLNAGVYLVHESESRIRDYYAETVSDDGDDPVIIEVDGSTLPVSGYAPDLHGIEEPLSYTLKISEEVIFDRWNDSKQTWLDSVNLIGTCRYMKPIPVSALSMDGVPFTAAIPVSATEAPRCRKPR